jgi:hypothetical protein
MTTTYRVTMQGRSTITYPTLEAACNEVAERMGWDECVLSDAFAVGSCEGARGSVYGYECYESEADLEAHQDGNGHAPRILRVRGDEAWAMGQGDSEDRA